MDVPLSARKGFGVSPLYESARVNIYHNRHFKLLIKWDHCHGAQPIQEHGL
jgi:hypothetical protein